MVAEGRNMPMSSSVLVDKDRAMNILRTMRINVPSAIQEGERMIQERDRIIAEARSHAETIKQEAQAKAKEILAEEELVLKAEQEATSILQQSEQETARMRFDAEAYQLNILRNLHDILYSMINEVERGVTELESRTHQPPE